MKTKLKKLLPMSMKITLQKVLMKLNTIFPVFKSILDKSYLSSEISEPKFVENSKWQEYLYKLSNKDGFSILEIGSREVCGKSNARNKFSNAKYTGFDYYAGNNVDVVGDVHKLSSYFLKNEKFDLIYSSACFEHFAMPWIVATEIAKLLKVGGFVFIETHFSFASHERPWHFFQYSICN